jgi:hypothetical protein
MFKTLILTSSLAAASIATVVAENASPVAGRWDIVIQFVHGTGNYTAFFEQDGEKLSGTYRGQFVEGDLEGTVRQDQIQFRGYLKIEGTRLLYDYAGTVTGESMSGTMTMGEYGEARWTATKHRSGASRR